MAYFTVIFTSCHLVSDRKDRKRICNYLVIKAECEHCKTKVYRCDGFVEHRTGKKETPDTRECFFCRHFMGKQSVRKTEGVTLFCETFVKHSIINT